MKHTTIIAGIALAVVAAFLAVPFMFYAYFGFLDWLRTDPMNWMADPTPPKENVDVVRCRESGGFPIKSLWDGSLKECRL